jgi:hypothetical protein
MTQFTEHLDFETLDADGAIRETADAVAGDTRVDFFRKAAVGGGAVFGGAALMGLLPSIASAKTPKSDVAILNFALTLEYLEAEFYNQAVNRGALSDPATTNFAGVVATDEAKHVAFLKKALGGKAVKSPKFDFMDTVTDQAKFQQTAYVLENTGVHAYLGQAGKIKTPAILLAAATIVTVEARHAGAIGTIIGKSIAPSGPFDKPQSKGTILKAVKGTGFIVG